jgi:hypothetical protein
MNIKYTKYTLRQRKRITESRHIEYDFVWATLAGELVSPVFGTMDKAKSYPILNAMVPTGKRLEDIDAGMSNYR